MNFKISSQTDYGILFAWLFLLITQNKFTSQWKMLVKYLIILKLNKSLKIRVYNRVFKYAYQETPQAEKAVFLSNLEYKFTTNDKENYKDQDHRTASGLWYFPPTSHLSDQVLNVNKLP